MKTEVLHGTLITYRNLAWGVLYEDSKSCQYGWVPMESARLYSENLINPIHVVYTDSPDIKYLKLGKVVKVKKTITTTLEFKD